MKVARHQRQHSDLQHHGESKQIPNPEGQVQTAGERIFGSFCKRVRKSSGDPVRQTAKVDPELCLLRFVGRIPRHVTPAAKGPHVGLRCALEPGHSETRDTPDGHKGELKARIVNRKGICDQQN